MPGEPEVVGRERELAELAGFLEAAHDLPVGLLLEGQAGIGKTTLLNVAIERGAQLGFTVLVARGAPMETGLAFAALSDLVQPLLDRVPDLPDPQRRSLEVALLLTAPTGTPPDERSLGTALLTLVQNVAVTNSVVLAIDDAQWIDPASAAALAFAAHRFGAMPIRMLVVQRTAEVGLAAPFDLERALAGRVRRLRVESLSLGAIHRVLATRLGLALPRPTLRRVLEASGGNPFFALQIGAVLRDLPQPIDPSAPLPIPPDLRELLRDRLQALTPSARDAVLAAALLNDADVSLVEQATSTSGVEDAIASGVVRLDGDRLFFTHPLLAEAAQSNATPARRREAHRRLAGVLDGSPRRAWHLAHGAEGADEDVAATLEVAAAELRGRGAPTAAAQLLQEASRLTPPDDPRAEARRTIAAANLWIDGGLHHHAAELVKPLADSLPSGGLRSDALDALARTVSDRAEFDRIQEQAVAEAAGDPARQAKLLLHSCYARIHANDLRSARAVADRAVAAGREAGEAGPLVLTTAMAGRVACWLGDHQTGIALLRESLEIEGRSTPIDAYEGPGTWLGWWHLSGDDLADARPLLEEQFRRSGDAGDDYSRLWLCWPMTELECRAGDYAAAARYADLGYALAEQLHSPYVSSPLLYARALVASQLGEAAKARRLAEESRQAAEEANSPHFAAKSRIVLGGLAISEGRPAEARQHLEPLHQLYLGAGRTPDAGYPYWPDLVEALIATDELAEAERLIARAESEASLVDRFGLLALVARSRALVAAHRGDIGEAAAHVERALELHDARPVPLERGRTVLLQGQLRRRAKQKRPAREALEAAADAFEQLSATLWVQRARGEIARIGGRTASPDALTATERTIASLVANGRTNREVAAELYLAPRTIESALTRIYAKLGVRSRTEMARRILEDGGGPGQP